MPITDLICEVYRWSRPNQIANGSMTYGDGVLLLLRVITEDGLEGHGWLGGTAAERPLEIFTPYISFYRERLVGRDPEDSAAIFADFEREHIKTFGFGGAHCQLTGAINCALWDLRGQAAGKPVHALLSGDDSSKKVRGYIAGGYYYGDDGSSAGLKRLRDELRSNVQDLKARSVKIKIGAPSAGIEIDTQRVAASREAIGPDIELMVDANCAFKDVATCVAYAKAFEPYDIYWFEEPFRPDAFDMHREFASAISIPVATGENVSTVPHFRELIGQGSVYWINADVAILTGGYDGGLDIWSIAKEASCHLAPHGCQELQCHYVAAADPGGSRLEIYPLCSTPNVTRSSPYPSHWTTTVWPPFPTPRESVFSRTETPSHVIWSTQATHSVAAYPLS
jgi:L-alanine-DL-glutamate epimerase-like enolase superfamily enzyme